MPKRNNSKKNAPKEDQGTPFIEDLVLEEYGKVEKALGDRRFTVQGITSKKTYVCHLRGALKKSAKICAGDYVLFSKRSEASDAMGDIVHKYSPEQVKALYKLGELPQDESAVEFIANDEEIDIDNL
jgi:translation initiation factor 1A